MQSIPVFHFVTKMANFWLKNADVSRTQVVCHMMFVFFGLYSGKYNCAKFHRLAINSIKQRFNQKDYAKYANSQELLLKAAKKVNFDSEFNSVIEFYKDDFDSMVLKTQLVTLGSIIPNDIRTFDEIVGYLKTSNSGVKSLISEVIKLTKLVLVCPATNATSERAFSALRRVKNYLQSTMNQIRVNNIMVLHVHKERTDNLDLIEIAREFVRGSENRLSIFGSFK